MTVYSGVPVYSLVWKGETFRVPGHPVFCIHSLLDATHATAGRFFISIAALNFYIRNWRILKDNGATMDVEVFA